MFFVTSVVLHANNKLAVPIAKNFEEWKHAFLKSSSKSKSTTMKNTFKNGYRLVELAESCNANYLNVVSNSNSILLITNFRNETDMENFVKLLADDKTFPI